VSRLSEPFPLEVIKSGLYKIPKLTLGYDSQRTFSQVLFHIPSYNVPAVPRI